MQKRVTAESSTACKAAHHDAACPATPPCHGCLTVRTVPQLKHKARRRLPISAHIATTEGTAAGMHATAAPTRGAPIGRPSSADREGSKDLEVTRRSKCDLTQQPLLGISPRPSSPVQSRATKGRAGGVGTQTYGVPLENAIATSTTHVGSIKRVVPSSSRHQLALA